MKAIQQPSLSLVSLILALLFSCRDLSAAVVVISNTTDSISNDCLRGAIIAANGSGAKDTILLQPGVYKLTLSGSHENQSQTGDLDITRGRLTISGNAASNTVIDAGGLGDRVFQIFRGTTLILSNLTVTGGFAPSGSDTNSQGGPGGGLYNAGSLSLYHCVVTTNSGGSGASFDFVGSIAGRGGHGGGIYNERVLFALDTHIIGNSSGNAGYAWWGNSGGSGGGIYNLRSAVLRSCTVENNITGYDSTGLQGNTNAPAPGGGIANVGSLVLSESTVNGNLVSSSGGIGGGIMNIGRLAIRNSLIASNTAGYPAGHGAGIVNSGTARIWSSTIAGNQCGSGVFGVNAGNGGVGGYGGGLFNTSKIHIRDSAIIENTAGAGGDSEDGLLNPPPAGQGIGGNGGEGGGVANHGKIWMYDSRIADNSAGNGGKGGFLGISTAGPGGQGGRGGGVLNAGQLNLKSCTIDGNRSGTGGEGGRVNAVSFPVDYEFSLGGYGGDGGGICNFGSARLRSCTVTNNQCGDGGSGGSGNTSGIQAGVVSVFFGSGGGGGSGGGIASFAKTIVSADTTVTGNSFGNGGAGGLDIFNNVTGPAGPDGENPDLLGSFQIK